MWVLKCDSWIQLVVGTPKVYFKFLKGWNSLLHDPQKEKVLKIWTLHDKIYLSLSIAQPRCDL